MTSNFHYSPKSWMKHKINNEIDINPRLLFKAVMRHVLSAEDLLLFPFFSSEDIFFGT